MKRSFLLLLTILTIFIILGQAVMGNDEQLRGHRCFQIKLKTGKCVPKECQTACQEKLRKPKLKGEGFCMKECTCCFYT
ncbi:unnamed protein product [Arabidopsis thaliana]|uniref:Uncharacterized protein n=1 Tax=Arabidopsis thaliana TaxID=3702 RepID=A0A5S9XJ09_ARATH|nr:unnamed protein product [Arabidopsis thaliana]